ncbi:exo-beta-N-acetylmuramidase NamZ family protein [Lederbergia citrea]|nr:DUF1343 domain-containing protein [Lederbergia citrea]
MKLRKKGLFTMLAVLLIVAFSLPGNTHLVKAKKNEGSSKVQPGIEVLLESHLDWIKDKRVGLVTNPTGVDSNLVSTVDLLFEHPDVNLTALFGPEHGIRGDQPAGAYVESYTDERTGLPVYSLYGSTWKPSKEMLENVDVLLFDIQDVGSNVYTYIYTLGFVMEAAAEFDKEVIVLDRPNPTGGVRVEGPVRNAEAVSFMGRFLLPVRHGMTVGELATMWNHEYSLGVNLKVAKMKGWKRTMHFKETGLPFVLTSPNIPTTETAFLYTGTELVDDTSLSTGLGTTKPFELLGAPWINGQELADDLNGRGIDGVSFRSAYFTPMFGKYQGQRVGGVQVHIDDEEQVNLVELGLQLVDAMKDQNPKKFEISSSYDSLIGDKRVRPMILEDRPVKEIMGLWKNELDDWVKNTRNHFLLYGPYPEKAQPYKPETVLGILPHNLELAPGQTKDLTVIGFDKNGNKLDVNPSLIKWEVKGEVGSIKGNTFTAQKAGTGLVTAKYKDTQANRNVVVAQNIINNIRHSVNPDYARVVFDLNKDTEYQISEEENQLILTVPYAEIGPPLSSNEAKTVTIANSPVISKVTFEIIDGHMFEARFHLKVNKVSYMDPYFSNRIVIDLLNK